MRLRAAAARRAVGTGKGSARSHFIALRGKITLVPVRHVRHLGARAVIRRRPLQRRSR